MKSWEVDLAVKSHLITICTHPSVLICYKGCLSSNLFLFQCTPVFSKCFFFRFLHHSIKKTSSLFRQWITSLKEKIKQLNPFSPIALYFFEKLFSIFNATSCTCETLQLVSELWPVKVQVRDHPLCNESAWNWNG